MASECKRKADYVAIAGMVAEPTLSEFVGLPPPAEAPAAGSSTRPRRTGRRPNYATIHSSGREADEGKDGKEAKETKETKENKSAMPRLPRPSVAPRGRKRGRTAARGRRAQPRPAPMSLHDFLSGALLTGMSRWLDAGGLDDGEGDSEGDEHEHDHDHDHEHDLDLAPPAKKQHSITIPIPGGEGVWLWLWFAVFTVVDV